MKAFITVIGKDKVGIIAAVSGLLAQMNINIEDISQTILQGTFTMIMAVDISGTKLSFDELSSELTKEGERLGIEIAIRHEDIFNAMHTV